ncbi:hypothetical protein ES703_104939 [subsurface metagenome]
MFVASVTGLSPESHIVAVINDVLEPSGNIAIGSAVLIIFAGAPVVVTFTVPSSKSVAVAVIVAVPAVVVDCSSTVDSPPTATFVVVPSNVP